MRTLELLFNKERPMKFHLLSFIYALKQFVHIPLLLGKTRDI